MISVSIEFDSTRFDRVLTAFLELPLPLPLRPVSFGEDEDKISSRRPIEEVYRFVADNPDAGFFLFAPTYICDFSFFGKKPSRADCDLKGGKDTAQQILRALAATQPLFGYACAYEERLNRNRLITKQGTNTIESWVGRDIMKYIPGLYWTTILSDFIVERYDIQIENLKILARDYIDFNSAHVIRFFDEPKDWRQYDFDAIRSACPAVFDIEKVRSQVSRTRTFPELLAVTSAWR